MPGKGKPFKQGNQAGKGHGRPKVPSDIREAKKLTQTLLEANLNRFIYLTEQELEAVQKDPTAPMLDKMIANIVYMASARGDQVRLDFLLNRLVGKVKEPDQNFNFNLSALPRAEVIDLGLKAIKFLKEGPTK